MEPDKIKFYQDLAVTEPGTSKKALKAKTVGGIQRKSISNVLASAKPGTTKKCTKIKSNERIQRESKSNVSAGAKPEKSKKSTKTKPDRVVQRKSISQKHLAEAKPGTSAKVSKAKTIKGIKCESIQGQGENAKESRYKIKERDVKKSELKPKPRVPNNTKRKIAN